MSDYEDFRDFDLGLPKEPELVRHVKKEADPNSEFDKQLTEWIEQYNAKLDPDNELGVQLASFGEPVIFRLKTLHHPIPSHISFSGVTEDGKPVELIQHLSQMSLLLRPLPRKDLSQPKNRIGFKFANE